MRITVTQNGQSVVFTNQDDADYWCHKMVFRQVHTGLHHGVTYVVIETTEGVVELPGSEAKTWLLNGERHWWVKSRLLGPRF